MVLEGKSHLPEVLAKYESVLLDGWIAELRSSGSGSNAATSKTELRERCSEFLSLLRYAIQSGNLTDIQSQEWERVLDMLAGMSRSMALQGFSPSDVATFIFSFKQPLFMQLKSVLAEDPDALITANWDATMLLDKLGLYTSDVFIATREEVISRQQQDMLELSTPVVKLWDGILALPMSGTLDSARTQVVMEALLQRIVETGAGIAIIDITGGPTVDTLVAQHLLKTVAAARLMGADCMISGIRPQIAQTIVHLGGDLSTVITKATLADAFAVALQRSGLGISRNQSRG